jgi:hypothetical protein
MHARARTDFEALLQAQLPALLQARGQPVAAAKGRVTRRRRAA